jgi:biotin-(acetyl-CoA carboxylase) ligase
MDKYKEKSMLIGKYVYIKDKEPKEQLLVKDIDDNTAALVVEHGDGRIEKLSTGEVSVRLMD